MASCGQSVTVDNPTLSTDQRAKHTHYILTEPATAVKSNEKRFALVVARNCIGELRSVDFYVFNHCSRLLTRTECDSTCYLFLAHNMTKEMQKTVEIHIPARNTLLGKSLLSEGYETNQEWYFLSAPLRLKSGITA